MALPTRTLITGDTVDEVTKSVKLVLDTHCPKKWLAMDLETGDVWRATEDGRWLREKELLVLVVPRDEEDKESPPRIHLGKKRKN